MATKAQLEEVINDKNSTIAELSRQISILEEGIADVRGDFNSANKEAIEGRKENVRLGKQLHDVDVAISSRLSTLMPEYHTPPPSQPYQSMSCCMAEKQESFPVTDEQKFLQHVLHRLIHDFYKQEDDVFRSGRF